MPTLTPLICFLAVKLMINDTRVIGKTKTTGLISSVLVLVLILLFLPLHLSKLSKTNSLVMASDYYVDNTFQSTLDDVLELQDGAWLEATNFNFGLSGKPHWLRLTIDRQKADGDHVLLLNYGLLDNVNMWFLKASENDLEVVGAYKTGDSLAFDKRIIKTEKFVFTVPASEQDLQVYLRVTSKGPLNIPLELWASNKYIEYANLHNLFLGLFFGFMMAMVLANVFVFATTRKGIFLVYAAYVCSITMVIASLQGVAFKYLWPNNLWLQENSVPIFASLTMICILSLTISLLALESSAPRINKILRNIRLIFTILLALTFVAPYEVTIKAVLVLLILVSPIIFGTGVILAVKGNIVAKYFCGAWLVLLSSGVLIALDSFGVYEPFVHSSYLVIVGSVTESVILALAMTINFSRQLLDAKHARDSALASEQAALRAKQELISLQDENQSNLEYSIEERTLELEIAMRELAEKNKELEKVSSLDPLTGLMNRRFFDKRVLAEARRSRREMTTLGVAMLDIDHFKNINDTYGHLCGDHCLQVFAKVLNETIKRPSDIVCRYGGEEFVLILPNTPIDGLKRVLEKVRQATQDKKIMFEGQEIQMTVSIGGCSRTIANEDEHELILAYADKLLYQAKEAGRNKVIVDSY